MEFQSKIALDKSTYSLALDPIVFDYGKKSKIISVVISAIIGISCLFSMYTIGLGIVILIVLLLIILAYIRNTKKNSSAVNRIIKNQNYRLFDNPLFYGFDEYGLSIKGEYLNVQVAWNYINKYKIHEDWIRITIYGMPNIYYRISEVQENNMYDDLINKLKDVVKG